MRIAWIQPSKPFQNTYIERFNRSFGEEVLNPHLLSHLFEAQEIKLGMALKL